VNEAEQSWRLVHGDGDEVLAEFMVTGGDFPWLNAEVQPAAGFADVRPLFEDELRQLELLFCRHVLREEVV
jgi:hypothetical protein